MQQHSVVTEHGRESVLAYQPVLAGVEGVPNDGIWLTGQVAVHNTILPKPIKAPEPQRLPQWLWVSLIAWLVTFGFAVGLVAAALLRR